MAILVDRETRLLVQGAVTAACLWLGDLGLESVDVPGLGGFALEARLDVELLLDQNCVGQLRLEACDTVDLVKLNVR